MFAVGSHKGAYRFLLVITLLASLTMSVPAGASPLPTFADPAFERVWQRTDLPVAQGLVARTWFWGPQPGAVEEEAFQRSPSGPAVLRKVQYFDKARMEVNDPSGDPNSPWYVTNGLLAVELIAGDTGPGSGKKLVEAQTGAPDIPLASDMDDADAPTYRSFRAVSDVPGNDAHQAKPAVGQPATATINREGQVGADLSKAALGNAVRYAYYETATRHNIAGAFWEFLNGADLVYEQGQTKLRLLSDPWYYATGFPISEAYWAKARIAGRPHDVLIQAFQRRVLTYVPDNPSGWKVQMGNIGQHYHQWRYGSGSPSPDPAPAAKPTGRIAFVSDRAGGGLNIYTAAPDGSDSRQVAKTTGYNHSPRFAPNGSAIAYVNVLSAQGAKPNLDDPALDPASRIMFTSDTQGGDGGPLGATSIAKWEGQSDPAYSPSGYLLAFRGKPAGEEPGLFVANLASDQIVIPVHRLTTGAWDRQPVWSPDGAQIAYTSGSNPGSSQIWVINSDGSGKRRLTEALARQIDQDPAWSPDGKRLVFASNRATGKFDVWSMTPDGTPDKALTYGESANQRHPSYSPDGKWIAFSGDREGNLDVYVAPADVSRWTNITHSPSLDAQPNWGK